MKPTIRFVIADVHMGLSHPGLSAVITEHKKKNPLFARTMDTEAGLVLFINKDRSKCKLYAENTNVLAYLSLPSGRISQKHIDLISASFGGSVEYAKAATKALIEFQEKDVPKKSPIFKTRLAV